MANAIKISARCLTRRSLPSSRRGIQVEVASRWIRNRVARGPRRDLPVKAGSWVLLFIAAVVVRALIRRIVMERRLAALIRRQADWRKQEEDEGACRKGTHDLPRLAMSSTDYTAHEDLVAANELRRRSAARYGVPSPRSRWLSRKRRRYTSMAAPRASALAGRRGTRGFGWRIWRRCGTRCPGFWTPSRGRRAFNPDAAGDFVC